MIDIVTWMKLTIASFEEKLMRAYADWPVQLPVSGSYYRRRRGLFTSVLGLLLWGRCTHLLHNEIPTR